MRGYATDESGYAVPGDEPQEYASDEEVNHYQQTDHDSFTIVYHDSKSFAKCDICGEEFECVGREYSTIYRESDQPDRTDPGYWKDNF